MRALWNTAGAAFFFFVKEKREKRSRRLYHRGEGKSTARGEKAGTREKSNQKVKEKQKNA